MLNRKLIVLIGVGALAGCATFTAAEKVAVDQASKVADDTLATATFAMCRAITVGAWMRAYGSDQPRADAWRTLCATPVTQTPAK